MGSRSAPKVVKQYIAKKATQALDALQLVLLSDHLDLQMTSKLEDKILRLLVLRFPIIYIIPG